MLGTGVVVIAIVVMLTIIVVDGVTEPSDLVVVLLLGVSLAVAAVPEGLPAILSVVLAIGVQLFNSLNARSEATSAFHGLFGNKWLWAAIGLSVALQVAVVEVPFLQVAFGTASMDLTHWAACVALGSVVLWYDELRKLLLRLTDHRSAAHRYPPGRTSGHVGRDPPGRQ